MEQEALFEEPEHLPPRTDGPWLVAPAPDCWRYQLLGEDAETLMVEGHGINDDGIRDVLLHAGQWWGFDEPVPMLRTWATSRTRCPRHGHLPRWLRAATRGPGERVRDGVFLLLWRLGGSRDPLRQRRRPAWLKRAQRRWHRYVNCYYCEWERDLAAADRGRGGYREELVGFYWSWGTDGNPSDANRGRRGYIPVTIVELEV